MSFKLTSEVYAVALGSVQPRAKVTKMANNPQSKLVALSINSKVMLFNAQKTIMGCL